MSAEDTLREKIRSLIYRRYDSSDGAARAFLQFNRARDGWLDFDELRSGLGRLFGMRDLDREKLWQAFGLDPAPLLLAREQAAQQQNNHLTAPPTPDVEGMRSAYASAQGVEPELTNFTACVQPVTPACSPCQQPAACPIMFVPASWWLPMRPSTCMYGRGA